MMTKGKEEDEGGERDDERVSQIIRLKLGYVGFGIESMYVIRETERGRELEVGIKEVVSERRSTPPSIQPAMPHFPPAVVQGFILSGSPAQ